MLFSERLLAYMGGCPEEGGFVLGDWIATLSGEDFTRLFDRVERVMYADESDVPEDEVLDVLHLAVWAYQFETGIASTMEPQEAERLAMDLEVAVWLETARRKGWVDVGGALSLLEARAAHVHLTSDGVSHAVARAWARSGAVPTRTCLH